ncbi:FAD-binding oxidoreductase [Phyllobacterium brassicacearum]|uniref:FAD-binding oxidoreductase n=1 Tax=Phyllobacterium brassicacearum TaxID=314235 RepID=A0A2P7AXU1_9HYPH|nr:FAD-binding oxidoreductase [Phyllobacterium brassicacearum]PSH59036.1 FAD-binding oxidoreductase [Phyllobacterium brassicacearum]TDQ08925.1 FAD/FMN-containing dehydrogenase [Phyllobacterium brassicacearum]
MPHDELRSVLHGELLEPEDAAYDDARIVWNGMIDRQPALIVRCRNAADVLASVNYARAHDLVISVRSGGHNVAGYAVCNGGLMIDMSLMNAVRIAPGLDRTCVEGGATWADVDAATTPFGRATPGGLISMTGVAGLTLSGGIGWLRGTHGLSCDNIIAADIVTAAGLLLRVSDTENTDLLWALKGGGGNFGVVVNFEFRLYPITDEMMFCAPAYPEERANEILPQWRDYMATAPDQVSGLAEFSTIPRDPAYPEDTWGKRVLALATVYDGRAEDGERVMQPLRSFGEPLLDFSGRMPYRVLQTLYDGLFPKGRDRCYWKSTYLRNLNEDVIQAITARLAKRPSEMTYASIWKFGGAVQRIAADATAFGDRSMPYMLSLDAIWSSPGEDDANISWVRDVWQEMQRHSTGRMYLNFPGLGEGDNLVPDAFGAATYARLQEIKRTYDPDNLFRMNQNILPR